MLSETLGVSPISLQKVKNASSRGSLSSEFLDDATPRINGGRNQFHERVANVLGPALKQLCSIPKFKVRIE